MLNRLAVVGYRGRRQDARLIVPVTDEPSNTHELAVAAVLNAKQASTRYEVVRGRSEWFGGVWPIALTYRATVDGGGYIHCGRFAAHRGKGCQAIAWIGGYDEEPLEIPTLAAADTLRFLDERAVASPPSAPRRFQSDDRRIALDHQHPDCSLINQPSNPDSALELNYKGGLGEVMVIVEPFDEGVEAYEEAVREVWLNRMETGTFHVRRTGAWPGSEEEARVIEFSSRLGGHDLTSVVLLAVSAGRGWQCLAMSAEPPAPFARGAFAEVLNAFAGQVAPDRAKRVRLPALPLPPCIPATPTGSPAPAATAEVEVRPMPGAEGPSHVEVASAPVAAPLAPVPTPPAPVRKAPPASAEAVNLPPAGPPHIERRLSIGCKRVWLTDLMVAAPLIVMGCLYLLIGPLPRAFGVIALFNLVALAVVSGLMSAHTLDVDPLRRTYVCRHRYLSSSVCTRGVLDETARVLVLLRMDKERAKDKVRITRSYSVVLVASGFDEESPFGSGKRFSLDSASPYAEAIHIGDEKVRLLQLQRGTYGRIEPGIQVTADIPGGFMPCPACHGTPYVPPRAPRDYCVTLPIPGAGYVREHRVYQTPEWPCPACARRGYFTDGQFIEVENAMKR